MYTFHEESLVALSAEAPPFFPAELLSLWSTRPDVAFQPPDKNFPSFDRPNGELPIAHAQARQLQQLEAPGPLQLLAVWLAKLGLEASSSPLRRASTALAAGIRSFVAQPNDR